MKCDIEDIAATMWEHWSTNKRGWDGELLDVERKSFLDCARKVDRSFGNGEIIFGMVIGSLVMLLAAVIAASMVLDQQRYEAYLGMAFTAGAGALFGTMQVLLYRVSRRRRRRR